MGDVLVGEAEVGVAIVGGVATVGDTEVGVATLELSVVEILELSKELWLLLVSQSRSSQLVSSLRSWQLLLCVCSFL